MADKVMYRGGGSTPVPDPTVLTTELTTRSISALREFIEAQLKGHRDVVNTRLSAMDEASRLLQGRIDAMPVLTDLKVATLKELLRETFKVHDERFSGLDKQFLERDARVEQAEATTAKAVNAALQAAKEAVEVQNKSFSQSAEKSERSTGEQISQQRLLLETTTKALSEKIDDLKDRVSRAEAAQSAAAIARAQSSDERTDQRGAGQYMLAIVVGAVGSLIGVGGLLVALLK